MYTMFTIDRGAGGALVRGAVGRTVGRAALATILSSHRALSLNGSSWRRYGLSSKTGLLLFVLLAAGWLVAEQDNVRLLLRAITVSGGLASLYGIAQYFGWDPLLPSKAYQAGEGPFTIVRPPGTLGHADYFAAWLVVVTFFGLALARLESDAGGGGGLGVSMLSIIAIVLSGTRAAMLGLVVGAVVLIFLRPPADSIARGDDRCRGSGGCAIFWWSPGGTKLRARCTGQWRTSRGGTRMLLWRDSLGMAAHRPVWGFGPETFATEFPRYESKELARAYPAFFSESPHNVFLDALTTRGAGGLLLLMGFCVLAIWAAKRRSRPELAAALAASLVCQQFTVFVVATSLYFYLLIAMLVAEPDNNMPERKSRWWLFPVGVAASVFFAAFTVRLLVPTAPWPSPITVLNPAMLRAPRKNISACCAGSCRAPEPT